MLDYIVYAAVFLHVLYWYYNKKTDTVPSPKGWPLIGNAAQLDLTKPHLKLGSWATELGGLYKINLAGTFVYVVNGYEEMHQVLVTNGKDFAGHPDTYRITYFYGQKNFSTSYLSPKFHSIKREVLHHVKLYGDAKEQSEQLFLNISHTMVDRLRDTNKQPVNIRRITQDIITDTMCLLIVGHRANHREQMMLRSWIDLMVTVLTIGGWECLIDVFPWLHFFGHKTYKAMVEFKSVMDKQFSVWKKEIRKNLGSEQLNDNLLTKLFQIMNGENKFDYDEENIKAAVFAVFAGRISTTTSSFTTLINVLVHNEEVQMQLHEESILVLGDRQVVLADKQNMSYHMATVYEILRYASSVPIGVPHETVCNTNISGHFIPKGSQVWTNLWALHHDPKVWDDPYSFQPERFLNSTGGLVAADHPSRKHMFAFGAGPRVCPGEVFALSRLFLLVASLVQNFKIEPATSLDEQPSADCRLLKLGLVLFPADFKVRFIPREI